MPSSRSYPPALRRRLAAMVRAGESPAALARIHGPSPRTIRRWAREQALVGDGEQRYQSLFHHHPDAAYSINLQGRYIDVNERACELTGARRDQILGHHFHEFLAEEDHERVDAAFAGLQRGEPQTLHATGVRLDGSRYDCRITAVPIVVDGELVGAHGITQDISEQLRVERERSASEQRYRALFETSLDGILLTDPVADGDGRILAANPAACAMLKRNEADLAGLGRSDLLVRGQPALAEFARGRGIRRRFRGELIFRRGDGTDFVAETTSAMFLDHRGRLRASVFIRDISQRRAAEQQLRLAANALSQTAEAVMILDAEGRIVSINRAFTKVTGYGEEQSLGRMPRLRSADAETALFDWIRQLVDRDGYWQGEVTGRRRDGGVYPALASISAVQDESGAVMHYVVVFNDISEYKDYESRLEFLAHHDVLTSLPNRLLAEDRVEEAIRRAHHHGSRLALLFLDLDHFKTVNDSLGHDAGDSLLTAVAERLRACVAETDTIARFGGDEFVVLLSELDDPHQAAAVALRLLTAFREPFEIAGRRLFATVSIGVSCYPDDGDNFGTLMRNADLAMYQAKREGRSTYQFYTAEMNADAVHALTVQNALHQALARDEFRLHYQPIVDLADGRIAALEALIRWQSDDLGGMSPAMFIPLAEESGLIHAIGDWVLREAARELRSLRQDGHADLRMTVNLSARQFRQHDLVERVAKVLRESGLGAGALGVEITETAVMHRVEDAMVALERLHRLGVDVALDDFGVGYSSLKYLKDFRIGHLKIDRTFVASLDRDSGSRVIVRTMIGMAKSMGIRVIAEGVETLEQYRMLRAWGCERAQGYLFSRPVAAAALPDLLARGSLLPDLAG